MSNFLTMINLYYSTNFLLENKFQQTILHVVLKAGYYNKIVVHGDDSGFVNIKTIHALFRQRSFKIHTFLFIKSDTKIRKEKSAWILRNFSNKNTSGNFSFLKKKWTKINRFIGCKTFLILWSNKKEQVFSFFRLILQYFPILIYLKIALAKKSHTSHFLFYFSLNSINLLSTFWKPSIFSTLNYCVFYNYTQFLMTRHYEYSQNRIITLQY